MKKHVIILYVLVMHSKCVQLHLSMMNSEYIFFCIVSKMDSNHMKICVLMMISAHVHISMS